MTESRQRDSEVYSSGMKREAVLEVHDSRSGCSWRKGLPLNRSTQNGCRLERVFLFTRPLAQPPAVDEHVDERRASTAAGCG